MIKVHRPVINKVREREVPEMDTHPEKPVFQRERPRKTRFAFWGVAIVSVLFFLFALSYLFAKVTVTINPKMEDVVLNENLSASKGNTGELAFDLIVISGEENKTIKTTEEKDFLERAEGTVIIYNAFGAKSQLLSIDTRLEGSNGKIYKTKKQIYVPGMKGSTPGSIEVGVYAAEPGEEYNSEPLDFKIFGFRGTPKYEKFYARSKGSLSGGFKGKAPYISDSEKAKRVGELKAALQEKLFKKATDQIPKGFVLFKNAAFLNIDEESIPVAGANAVFPLKIKGTLYGFLLDEERLNKKIAKDKIKDYDGGPVYLADIKNLNFSLMVGPSGMDYGSTTAINFNLSGKSKVVWKVDENKFTADLLGKAKKDFKQILLSYPNIVSADLLISPFWKRTLPDKKKNIEVIVNYPK